MKRNTLLCLLGLMVLVALERCHGQGETAVPFLLIPASPEGNGMGGIAGTTVSGNPLAVLSNPGELGITSLDHYFVGGLYPSSTTWMPGMQNSDMHYTASAFGIGFNLKRVGLVPFGLSLGLAFSHVRFNEGTFKLTYPGPSADIRYFDAEEYTDNLSVGIGMDYFVRIGLGCTSKSVRSTLVPFEIQVHGKQGVASFSSYDFGLIVQVPVLEIIGRAKGAPIKFSEYFQPLFDISFSYARRNMGNVFVTYIDAAQADPLPRAAMLGLSYKVGLTVASSSGTWEVFSVTLAREAEDVLVERFPTPRDSTGASIGEPPAPQYLDGSGAIQFFNNVVLGAGNARITLRKGWQINLGNFVLLRGGSVQGRGESYKTSGYGLRLNGLLQLLWAFSPEFAKSPVAKFIITHVDFCYDHASSDYDNPNNLNEGVTYNGISIVVK